MFDLTTTEGVRSWLTYVYNTWLESDGWTPEDAKMLEEVAAGARALQAWRDRLSHTEDYGLTDDPLIEDETRLANLRETARCLRDAVGRHGT